MVNLDHWNKLLKEQPYLCIDLKKILQLEYDCRTNQKIPDEKLQNRIFWCHYVLKDKHITVKYDTSLQDIVELLSL